MDLMILTVKDPFKFSFTSEVRFYKLSFSKNFSTAFKILKLLRNNILLSFNICSEGCGP